MWQIPDAVGTVICAPDDGWWYHPKHVEEFPNKINCVTLNLIGYILEQFYIQKFCFLAAQYMYVLYMYVLYMYVLYMYVLYMYVLYMYLITNSDFFPFDFLRRSVFTARYERPWLGSSRQAPASPNGVPCCILVYIVWHFFVGKVATGMVTVQVLQFSHCPYHSTNSPHSSSSTLLSRNTIKMQLCNRIYYSKVYWRPNMFRAAHRSSSGGLNCICSLWFICPYGDRTLPRLSKH